MKSIAIAGALLAAPALAEQDNFAVWSKKHGKKYATKEEMVLRRSIFAANLAKINKHNAEGHSWTMGVNKFADLTADEFKAMYAGGLGPVGSAMPKAEKMVMPKNLSANPTSVDWDAKGAVTPVKNQGQCGSCWAFSTTGSVESATFLKTGTLPSLSEQQLVDCSGSQGNEGCNGGWYYWAYQYIIDNKGITTETAYPYTAADGTCAATGKPVGATLTSFKEVPASSETALETAIVQQPISVAVEADQDVFQFYTSGVMDSACGTNIDHAILAVGYGTDAGKDYYKVKNSWGADWGMKGYILLGRGAKFNPSGQCGVQLYPYYPIA